MVMVPPVADVFEAEFVGFARLDHVTCVEVLVGGMGRVWIGGGPHVGIAHILEAHDRVFLDGELSGFKAVLRHFNGSVDFFFYRFHSGVFRFGHDRLRGWAWRRHHGRIFGCRRWSGGGSLGVAHHSWIGFARIHGGLLRGWIGRNGSRLRRPAARAHGGESHEEDGNAFHILLG